MDELNRGPSVWRRWWRALQRWRQPPDIPDGLWRHTVRALPFVAERSPEEQNRLRGLCAGFLASKEFHGTQGLRVSDAMALHIAAQACLPLLHWGPQALRQYGDFVGIVVHPDEVLAQRERAAVQPFDGFHRAQVPRVFAQADTPSPTQEPQP